MIFLSILAKLTLWKFKPKVVAVTGGVGKSLTVGAIASVLGAHARSSNPDVFSDFSFCLTILDDLNQKELQILTKKGLSRAEIVRKIFLFSRIISTAFLKIIAGQKINPFDKLRIDAEQNRSINPFDKLRIDPEQNRRVNYPPVLILEYKTEKPGDMRKYLDLAEPFIGVMTTAGEIPPHLEFWSGENSFSKERARLIDVLTSDGFAVLNFDDEAVLRMKERTRARVITFGFGSGADVKIINFETKLDEGNISRVSFKINYGNNVVPVILRGFVGKSSAYAAASAVCVGLIFDLNLVEIAEALSYGFKPLAGRMRAVPGLKKTLIIDGSLHASPESMHEALDTLRSLPAKRKIAVLGDMLYLGKWSIETHENIGLTAAKSADILMTVGPRGKIIASGAQKAGLKARKIYKFDEVSDAVEPLLELIREGDLILINGSREIGLDKLVEEIRAG